MPGQFRHSHSSSTDTPTDIPTELSLYGSEALPPQDPALVPREEGFPLEPDPWSEHAPTESSAEAAIAPGQTPARRRLRLRPLKAFRRFKLSEASRRRWTFPALWLSLLLSCTGIGVVALAWLARLPPLPNCEQLPPLAPDVEQLYCAQQAAQSQDLAVLTASIQKIKAWTPEHPLYEEAQTLLGQWSSTVMAIATQKVNQGDLEAAIAAVRQIPANSPLHQDAEATVQRWQAEWQRGRMMQRKAQKALQGQKWEQAKKQQIMMVQLNQNYWSQKQASKLRERIETEEKAAQNLIAARQQAQSGSTQGLSQAIRLVQAVPPKTYAWEAAQAELTQWSERLLTLSVERWDQGDLAGAIAAAEGVPTDPRFASHAQQLIRISTGEKAVLAHRDTWKPSVAQVFSLQEAIAAAQSIPFDSPFYGRAQEKLSRWQRELTDVVQLQYAQMTANVAQKWTYEAAIAQAEMIAPERPGRSQAQTLMAHWTNEVERIEDRPYLKRARALATQGTIPAFQAAIAQAQKVELGRALRIEAQTDIADWQYQIQILEDQPILDEAIRLAQQGQYSRAINVAYQIQSDRALYGQAQQKIGDWNYQLLIARDRRLLNEAIGLAEQDYLTRAIEIAGQIGSGPVAGEAQSYIARWKEERAEIWQMWDENAATDDSYYEDDPYYEDPYYEDDW